MNIPKFDYESQGTNVMLEPIFECLKKYFKEWKVLSNKGYVENIVYCLLGISDTNRELKNCEKEYNNNPNDIEKIKKIAKTLYGNSKNGIGLYWIVARNAVNLGIFHNNIEKIFESLGSKVENIDSILKTLNGKKVSEQISKAMNELINIQNEIFKSCNMSSSAAKTLNKEFKDNLPEMVEIFGKIPDDMNKGKAPDIMRDLQKLENGNISTALDSNILNELSSDALEISKDIAILNQSLSDFSNKKRYSIKSIFSKKNSKLKRTKTKAGKKIFLKDTIKENIKELKKITNLLKSRKKQALKINTKKKDKSKNKNDTQMPSFEQIKKAEKKINENMEKQRRLIMEYEKKIGS